MASDRRNYDSYVSTSEKPSTADRIVRAAAALLAEGGRDAVSTRTVSQAAGVQTPTIYRLFGDMRGLFDAVASYGFAEYLATTMLPEGPVDPLDELRRGYDMHVEFGLTNPGIYKLMYGSPSPGVQAEFMRDTLRTLEQRVENVARAGLLRVSIEEAVLMMHSVASGVTMTLLGLFPEQRDLSIIETSREATIAAMTVPGTEVLQSPRDPVAEGAITIDAHLDGLQDVLSDGERALLAELLARIARRAPRAAAE